MSAGDVPTTDEMTTTMMATEIVNMVCVAERATDSRSTFYGGKGTFSYRSRTRTKCGMTIIELRRKTLLLGAKSFEQVRAIKPDARIITITSRAHLPYRVHLERLATAQRSMVDLDREIFASAATVRIPDYGTARVFDSGTVMLFTKTERAAGDLFHLILTMTDDYRL